MEISNIPTTNGNETSFMRAFLFLLAIGVIYILYEIFKCVKSQIYHHWFGPSYIIQNAKFRRKHINSYEFIRRLLLHDPKSVRLTKNEARILDSNLKPNYVNYPKTITILPTRPSFSRYKHFFGNYYYTEEAVSFYGYKTKEKKIIKCNQRLFVCFSHFEGRPLEVHMCDQNWFWWILNLYTALTSFLNVALFIIGQSVKIFSIYSFQCLCKCLQLFGLVYQSIAKK